MDKEEARIAILKKWPSWWALEAKKDDATGIDGLQFFNFIRKEHPELLKFGGAVDEWQVVRGWLQRANFIS